MEASTTLACLAFVSAFFCATTAFVACSRAAGRLARGWRLVSSVSGERTGAARLMEGGFPLFVPLARLALRLSSVASFIRLVVKALSWHRVRASAEGALSIGILCLLLAFCLGFLVSSSVVCGLVVAACLVLATSYWANAEQTKRREGFREAIPDAIRTMQACFLVGHSLSRTFRQVGERTRGPLGELFLEAEAVMTAGGTVDEALACLADGSADDELTFLAAALRIQHQTGSSMQQVLDVARLSIEEEMELRRSLKTQTAQARLSARIVTAMPFVLIGLFSLVSEGFLDPFFESLAGMALLAMALVMQVAGVLMVRKMLRIEVA